jgi:hypothetical protein
VDASAHNAQHDALARLGVAPDARQMVGVAFIEPRGDFYKTADSGGLPAVLVPCLERGELLDLVAFGFARPERFWRRLGDAWALGADRIADHWPGQPIRVVRSPLAYLQAGADALCPLDWRRARHELTGFDLLAESADHAAELDRRLTLPARHPKILLPQARKSAA